jgi:hypothetical protein
MLLYRYPKRALSVKRHAKLKHKIAKVYLPLVLVLFTTVAIGIYARNYSHAATPYASEEAESGTIASSATTESGSTASNSKYVQFGVFSMSSSGFTATSIGPTKLQGFAVTGTDFVDNTSSQMSAMLKAFPGMDAIRISIGTNSTNVIASVNETSLIAAVNTAIEMDPNIQIVLDDHESEGAQQIGDTAADLALYQQWGEDFKNNVAHVSFNTPNEPGGDSGQITSAEQQVYDTIRATGASNRVWLEDGGYFPTVYQQVIDSDKMVNIGMDTHLYPSSSSSSATTDLANDGLNQITDSNGIALQQSVFEFGPSQDGPASDDNSASTNYVGQVVSIAQSGKSVMTTAWIWTLNDDTSIDGLEDLVATSSGTIGQFGTLLQTDDFAQTQVN